MHPRSIAGYELVAEIGRGGMGVVWEARHPGLPGRRLALKQLSSALTDAASLVRFLAEARSLARVQHPAVVRIHAAGQEGGVAWLVTDLVEGRPLDLVLTEGPMEPARAAGIVAELADALEAVHAAGVVHRDVKPQNVLLLPGDRPVLLDFGLARELDRASLTATGELLGTPAYMAPEQVLDGRRADARADVYALGAVFHALVRGRPPFRGSLVAVLEAVVRGAVEWPATRHGPLDAVCRRAMAREPERRFQTATSLGEALRTAAAEQRPRVPRPLIAAACVGVGLLLVAALTAQEPDAAPRPSAAPANSQSGRPDPPPPLPDEASLIARLEAGAGPDLPVAWRESHLLLAQLRPTAGERLRARLRAIASPLATTQLEGGDRTLVRWIDAQRLVLLDKRRLARWVPGRTPDLYALPEPLAPGDRVLCVMQGADGQRVACFGGGSGSMEVELDGRWPELRRPQSESRVYAYATSDDGRRLGSIIGPEGAVPAVSIGDARAVRPHIQLVVPADEHPVGLCWVAPDRLVVVLRRQAGGPDAVRAFDLGGAEQRGWRWLPPADEAPPPGEPPLKREELGACTALGDGRLLVEQGETTLRVVGPGPGPVQLYARFPAGQAIPVGAVLLPPRLQVLAVSGRWVFAGGGEDGDRRPGRVCMLELLPSLREEAELRWTREWALDGQVVSLAVSPDGTMVAAATLEGAVALLGVPP